MSENKGMLLAGDLYVSVMLASGEFGGWSIVECDELSIATPGELVEAVSRRRGARYGQPHTSIAVPQPATFSARFTETSKSILAMALSGALETLTIAGGALTGDDVELPEDDSWTEVGIELISGTVTVAPAVGDPFEAGKDYELNPRLGMIRRLPGGDIAAGATVKVTATGDALTSHRILGGSQPRTVMRWKLDGEDRVSGRDVLLWADRTVIMSTEARNFLDSAIATVPLTGKFEIPDNGVGAPFVWEYR